MLLFVPSPCPGWRLADSGQGCPSGAQVGSYAGRRGGDAKVTGRAAVDVVAAVADGTVAKHLLTASARVATAAPLVTGSRLEAELALRSRSRDLFVFDPDVVDPSAALAMQVGGLPRLVAWLGVRSPGRTADLLDAGVEEVLDASMTEVEMAARLRRVARGGSVPVVSHGLTLGELRVDARRRVATWRERSLGLTPREVEVLQVLVAGAGLTVGREVIYRQVWRWSMPRGDRTVDVNVKRLRDKLAAAAVPARIVSEPGVGYRLAVMADSEVVTGL